MPTATDHPTPGVHRQGLAAAFGLPEPWPPSWAPSEVTHHRFGLWNCQDDGFYRFVYHHVRTTEGPAWLTNDRPPAQLERWWDAYQRAKGT